MFQYGYSFCIDSSLFWHYSPQSPCLPFPGLLFPGVMSLLGLMKEQWGPIAHTKSPVRRVLALAWWLGFRKFLRPLPWWEKLVLGNVLVSRRFLQLDYRAVVLSVCDDAQRRASSPGNSREQPLLDLHIRRSLGPRRPHFRSHHALSRHVSRHGRRSRLHRRIRDFDAPDFSRRIQFRGDGYALRANHPRRRRRLSARHLFCRSRGHVERKRNVRRAEARFHQGV